MNMNILVIYSTQKGLSHSLYIKDGCRYDKNIVSEYMLHSMFTGKKVFVGLLVFLFWKLDHRLTRGKNWHVPSYSFTK